VNKKSEKLINYCDVCSEPLTYRMDDRPEIIERRMVIYKEEVEHNFLSALKLYPHFTYNTNRPLEDCLQFYTKLNKMIREYPGDAREFVHHLQGFLP
jgi:adenylate kinase family enzyme